MGGNQRLPLARAGAGDGEPHRAGPVGVGQVEPDAPERLQRLGGVRRLLDAVLAPLDGGHRAENGQAEFAGHLVGVAEPLVELVEQDRQGQGEPDARHESEHDDARRRIRRRAAAV